MRVGGAEDRDGQRDAAVRCDDKASREVYRDAGCWQEGRGVAAQVAERTSGSCKQRCRLYASWVEGEIVDADRARGRSRKQRRRGLRSSLACLELFCVEAT